MIEEFDRWFRENRKKLIKISNAELDENMALLKLVEFVWKASEINIKNN